jgi:hypothetical protein
VRAMVVVAVRLFPEFVVEDLGVVDKNAVEEAIETHYRGHSANPQALLSKRSGFFRRPRTLSTEPALH